MNPIIDHQMHLTRRQLLSQMRGCVGGAALAALLSEDRACGADSTKLDLPHFKPTAKRVIYLFMAGGPSHIDTFDYKPELSKIHGKELPDSVRKGQRLTTMTSGQKSFPCVAPMFKFKRFGERGTWVNADLLPHTASIVDEITIVKSMHTEAINHDPAITFINTGTRSCPAVLCTISPCRSSCH